MAINEHKKFIVCDIDLDPKRHAKNVPLVGQG